MENVKKKRGFSAMTKEKHREICLCGGKAVPAEKRIFSQDREHASAMGKRSGEVRRAKAWAAKAHLLEKMK